MEDAVQAIARDLAALDDLDPGEAAEGNTEARAAVSSSLGWGWAGVSLFFSYLSGASGDEEHGRAGQRALDRCLAIVERSTLGPSLYSGYTGIGWLIAHDPGPGDDADTEMVDDAVLHLLADPPQGLRAQDLLHGLVGIGLYGLERLPGGPGEEIVERVVQSLADRAVREPAGITWWTAEARLAAEERALFPGGCCVLGTAHGVAGAIGFLAATALADICNPLTRELLEGATRWLIAQGAKPSGSLCYPSYLTTHGDRSGARAAWCHGDPGIAATLNLAAAALRDGAVTTFSIDLACRAAELSAEEAGVVDGALCHGTAGLAHIFHRLYRKTADQRLRRAALLWLERTLEVRREGSGIGGFSSLAPDRGAGPRWHPTPGFLQGAAGIGLVLVGFLEPMEPEWDRLLLLSARGRAG